MYITILKAEYTQFHRSKLNQHNHNFRSKLKSRYEIPHQRYAKHIQFNLSCQITLQHLTNQKAQQNQYKEQNKAVTIKK